MSLSPILSTSLHQWLQVASRQPVVLAQNVAFLLQHLRGRNYVTEISFISPLMSVKLKKTEGQKTMGRYLQVHYPNLCPFLLTLMSVAQQVTNAVGSDSLWNKKEQWIFAIQLKCVKEKVLF